MRERVRKFVYFLVEHPTKGEVSDVWREVVDGLVEAGTKDEVFETASESTTTRIPT